MADQAQGGDGGAVAPGPPEGDRSPELAFSFMDKVRFMMYGEQEKEAFLIEKKEKEEKKKAKKAEKLRREAEKKKKKQEASSSQNAGDSSAIDRLTAGGETSAPDTKDCNN